MLPRSQLLTFICGVLTAEDVGLFALARIDSCSGAYYPSHLMLYPGQILDSEVSTRRCKLHNARPGCLVMMSALLVPMQGPGSQQQADSATCLVGCPACNCWRRGELPVADLLIGTDWDLCSQCQGSGKVVQRDSWTLLSQGHLCHHEVANFWLGAQHRPV